MTSSTPTSRRWFVWILRIAVLVLVCFAVSGTVRSALSQLAELQWELHPAWLVAAGAVYIAGLMPMPWFWRRELASLQYPAPFLVVVRAYFLGQLGKYVPGKAMAVVLRVAAVRRWVPSMRIAIVSVFLETLTMMATGGFLAFVLSLLVLRSEAYITLIALGMTLAPGLPTLPPIARRIAGFNVRRFQQDEGAKPDPVDVTARLRVINFRLLAVGWIAAVVCWLLLGISLWLTLRAVGVERSELLSDMPLMVTTVAFAVVAGFLSMLPGGIVVRDAVLMELLAPVCGAANALVVAVLMRLVWLVSEVVACGILYVGVASRQQGPGSRDKTTE
ncbi:MAG TPA: lysylphosphatidylglycerol synthase transmembrane domain-containing protein [Lacipirellulaceae bacterium]|nr:lysylphosphatidylglycerol synthase transmembrane domain-containing protein [Lacipirellulaceae bacterium]